MLQAAEFIPAGQPGSCDDCGFAPFGDDISTSREIAFGKLAARVAEPHWPNAADHRRASTQSAHSASRPAGTIR